MNLTHIVEAIYQHHTSDPMWLASIAEAVQREPSAPRGVAAWSTAWQADGEARSTHAHAGMAASEADTLAEGLGARVTTHCWATCGAHAAIVPCRRPDPLAPGAASEALEQVLLIAALDPGRQGITLAIPLPRPCHTEGALRRSASALARHLDAGLRLRRMCRARELDEDTRTPGDSDPPGPVLSVPASQVAGLRAIVVEAGGQAKQDGTDDADAAQRVWHQLVDGQLACRHSFAADGQRYLVLQHASTDSERSAGLSQRRRRVLALRRAGLPLKVLASELRVSTSTISHDVAAALEHLGLGSVNDLGDPGAATLELAHALTLPVEAAPGVSRLRSRKDLALETALRRSARNAGVVEQPLIRGLSSGGAASR